MLEEPIEAVFENGVFRPLSPVDLPEHQRVRLIPQAVGTEFHTTTPTFADAPRPQEPFLTDEISAPSIPWPAGKLVRSVRVDAPLPTAHDVPEED